MTQETNYKCNVCGEEIEKGHQEIYMATISIQGYGYDHNEGGTHWSETFHVHHDLGKNCLEKILKLLEK